jgi:hypothetical protein
MTHIAGYRKPSAKILLACLALALPLPALSALLHGQAPVDGGDGAFSNASAGAQNADNFSVSAPEHIESITWWGSYDTLDTDSFIVRILSDSAGAPGPVLRDYQSISVTATPTALADIQAAQVYRYDFTLPDSLLLPPGSFYLSVTDETQNSAWHWLADSGGDSAGWQRVGDGDAWSPQANAGLAFGVNGRPAAGLPELAEPSSAWLFGMGLLPLAAGLSRDRHKMAKNLGRGQGSRAI